MFHTAIPKYVIQNTHIPDIDPMVYTLVYHSMVYTFVPVTDTSKSMFTDLHRSH